MFQGHLDNYNYRIDVVKFDEDFSIWYIFHEKFKYFVYNKSELGKTEKLLYLLCIVTGKALRSCSSIKPIMIFHGNCLKIFMMIKKVYLEFI